MGTSLLFQVTVRKQYHYTQAQDRPTELRCAQSHGQTMPLPLQLYLLSLHGSPQHQIPGFQATASDIFWNSGSPRLLHGQV